MCPSVNLTQALKQTPSQGSHPTSPPFSSERCGGISSVLFDMKSRVLSFSFPRQPACFVSSIWGKWVTQKASGTLCLCSFKAKVLGNLGKFEEEEKGWQDLKCLGQELGARREAEELLFAFPHQQRRRVPPHPQGGGQERRSVSACNPTG